MKLNRSCSERSHFSIRNEFEKNRLHKQYETPPTDGRGSSK